MPRRQPAILIYWHDGSIRNNFRHPRRATLCHPSRKVSGVYHQKGSMEGIFFRKVITNKKKKVGEFRVELKIRRNSNALSIQGDMRVPPQNFRLVVWGMKSKRILLAIELWTSRAMQCGVKTGVISNYKYEKESGQNSKEERILKDTRGDTEISRSGELKGTMWY